MPEPFAGTVLCFAVEREVKAFLRLYPDHRRIAPDRWLCDERILVTMLGVGLESTRKIVESLLSTCKPQRMIVAGFAGALRAGLVVGDVLAVSSIVDESCHEWQTSWPEARAGRLFTSTRMIGEPAEKLALGEKLAADIVDMESAAVAVLCQQHDVAFGCVRVVSDDVSKPLSQRLMGLVESGRVSIRRVLWEVARSPRLGVELVRLAKQTSFAADRLACRLRELLA